MIFQIKIQNFIFVRLFINDRNVPTYVNDILIFNKSLKMFQVMQIWKKNVYKHGDIIVYKYYEFNYEYKMGL